MEKVITNYENLSTAQKYNVPATSNCMVQIVKACKENYNHKTDDEDKTDESAQGTWIGDLPKLLLS